MKKRMETKTHEDNIWKPTTDCMYNLDYKNIIANIKCDVKNSMIHPV